MTSPPATLPLDPRRVETTCRRVIYRDERQAISIAEIVALLLEAGSAVYASGGAVRDWLLGEEPRDVDLYVDRELAEVHELLRRTYPGIDPATRPRPDGYLLRWGGNDALDICILRSPRDIRGKDAWTTVFPARDSVADNALMMDFSFHSYHYDFRRQRLLDPLGCGLRDLERRRLRLTTSPAVLEATSWPSLRIVQFLQRGFTAEAGTLAYLERNADLDVQGMGRRLWRWIPVHVVDTGGDLDGFIHELRTWLRDPASHRLLDGLVDDLHRTSATRSMSFSS